GANRPLPGFSSPLMPIPPPASRGMVPPHVFAKAEMQRRRKTILEGLLIGAGCTFVLGLLPPLRFFLVLFVLDIVALAGYVALLLQWKRNQMERNVKVRPLAARRPQHAPVPVAAFEEA